MDNMTHRDLNRGLVGGGLPALSAVRFFRGLLGKHAQYQIPDPLADYVRNRPVTQEVTGDTSTTTLRNAAAVIAQQQAELEQAKAELGATVNQAQGVKQQSDAMVQQMQGQLQQINQRAQQAEQGLAQAQGLQQQMGMQMAQMAQSQLVAGEQAVAAKMEATAAHRDRQDLEQSLLSWKSGLQQMIDNDPIQQRMQQKLMAQQQQAMAQQQAAQQQQQQGMPQGAGEVEKAAAAETSRREQRQIIFKLAMGKDAQWAWLGKIRALGLGGGRAASAIGRGAGRALRAASLRAASPVMMGQVPRTAAPALARAGLSPAGVLAMAPAAQALPAVPHLRAPAGFSPAGELAEVLPPRALPWTSQVPAFGGPQAPWMTVMGADKAASKAVRGAGRLMALKDAVARGAPAAVYDAIRAHPYRALAIGAAGAAAATGLAALWARHQKKVQKQSVSDPALPAKLSPARLVAPGAGG